MTRLQSEWQRLYAAAPANDSSEAAALLDAQGHVRAMVLEVGRPADWSALSAVWQGVQADLGLPAPAIAVSGQAGYQLWFSLAQAVPAAQATAFLSGLQARYLPDIAPPRVGIWPVGGNTAEHGLRHAAPVPAAQTDTGNWSAFLAPDLAPVFADTPWLDIPPNLDGQAELLSRLACISASEFESSLLSLCATGTRSATEPPTAPACEALTQSDRAASSGAAPGAHPRASRFETDPRRFLLEVMNDEALDMHLRIEAAKALLP